MAKTTGNNIIAGNTNAPTTTAPQAPAQVPTTAGYGLKMMFSKDDVKKRFNEMLGKKSAGFLSSVLTLTNNNKLLQNANPATILSAASIAASLDLPVNPSLGFAWIVPYKGDAAFQLGYKGFVQLAQRSGLYRAINVVEVCEGECEKWDKFAERMTFGEKKSDAVVGYYGYFELLNGFKKSVYWTKEEVTKHAKKYSKAFHNGPWQEEFDKMAKKTVLANMLKAWGPMSIEMQTAFEADDKIVTSYGDDGVAEYKDVEVMADGDFPDAGNIKMVDGQAVNVVTGEIVNKNTDFGPDEMGVK